ncbi:MAG: hypothetical protein DSZ25_02005 [Thermovibrio sp.]|nr:MAG: hypothetical protein DSZ25_02005 [Thermovibrio sp.]
MGFFRILILLFLLTSSANADWYILLPKKRPERKPIPKNVPIPKLKQKKVKPKPYTVELNRLLAPDFSIPQINGKISKDKLYGKNITIIFVNSLFSPFTEGLTKAIENLNSKRNQFVIVSVSDSDFAFINTFRKLLNVKRTIVTADSYLFQQFKSKLPKLSVPSIVVIDKYGFIRFISTNIKGNESEVLVSQLRELLKEIDKG